MVMQPVNLIYSTPDLPGPAMVEMFVPVSDDEDAWDFRRRALIIAEATVQATLALYGVRAEQEEDD